jgi:ubiquinone/menaquinone biosynthesis C-methylase UbiE
MAEHHEPKKQMRALDSEERAKWLRTRELIKEESGVTRGMTCIDLGCGGGVFAFPMVLAVGDEGTVYAVDINAEALGIIRKKNPPANLKLLERDAARTGLESQIADFCLIALLLHEVEQPGKVMDEAFRLLKPEGKVMIMEWRTEPGVEGPPHNERIAREKMEQLFEQAGFSGFKYNVWTRSHYVASGNKNKSD